MTLSPMTHSICAHGWRGPGATLTHYPAGKAPGARMQKGSQHLSHSCSAPPSQHSPHAGSSRSLGHRLRGPGCLFYAGPGLRVGVWRAIPMLASCPWCQPQSQPTGPAQTLPPSSTRSHRVTSSHRPALQPRLRVLGRSVKGRVSAESPPLPGGWHSRTQRPPSSCSWKPGRHWQR